ncbi:family 43 glycosylhydrolase [Cellulomonas sp. PhB143]|uniref:family 43 glycosylhydrolase n=1 Tax=Cellulomonas sp. PhB143 TaxID=2485186 RepID=UPI000F461431|nr:family 43 glycosylhydrolase [Cellulomonas sp. PhB143]ROS78419.1 carbohydrate-binding protein with CBM35 doain [Cellulomonas sp. PhB143]
MSHRTPPARSVVVARALVAAVAGLVLAAVGLVLPAGAAPTDPALAPVIDASFADPDVLLVDGVYHAYATNVGGQNVQHRTSTDLRTWTVQPDAAPTLGDWVGACSFAPGGATDRCVWAPEVTVVDGRYALYYTARDATSPRQCIGVALSDDPAGPFEPVGDQPLVCPNGEGGTADLGGAIDASTYREGDQLFLLWKADGNCCEGKAAIIFAQPLSADGTTLTGPPTELLRVDRPSEGKVVEAPTLVRHDGTYYLFYSANDFYGGAYRTAYATAPSVTGPYTKATTELMTSDRFQDDVRGPGGQDVVPAPGGGDAIVFHGWDPTFTYRAMYVSDLEWSADGVPSVSDASDRYEAEAGAVTHARVVADPKASGGSKVGGMDFPDSAVSVRVHAEAAGPATLGIRYDNGSTAGAQRVSASDTVTVNGRDAGTVTFAHTTWGSWQDVAHPVELVAGWNTVTLTRATYYAEIDAVDVYGPVDGDGPAAPPVVPADAVRYELEDGTITHASAGADPSASAGAKVGGMDFADSSVSVQVYAAKAGATTLALRFANGSERGGYPLESSDAVTVNGRDAGTVTFPHTTWGNWQTRAHDVDLAQGWNTVTLTKATWYTELDAVDVYPSAAAPPAAQLAVEAVARCVGTTPYVAVRATNTGTEAAAVVLSTPFGEKAVASVRPGASAAQSFKVRGALVPGEVTVTRTAQDGTSATVRATYSSVACAS